MAVIEHASVAESFIAVDLVFPIPTKLSLLSQGLQRS